LATVVVSHALEVGPDSIWYPQLQKELGADGHEVDIVRLPDPSAPDAEAWLKTLTAAIDTKNAADTVLVGHSLGGVNTLRLLQRHDVERKGAFAGVVLVATMAHSVGYDALAGFFEPPFDWTKIRASAGQFRILAAADDPVLAPDPMGHVKKFVDELGATTVLKATGGHFPSWSAEVPPDLAELPEVTHLVVETLGSGA
jgi:hypothetical protein